MSINDYLEEIVVDIDDILLDPNNPRYSKHYDEIIPLEKVVDANVQEEAYKRMTDPKNNFEIDELVEAIKADGFIHVDKIFVRKVGKKYLTVEGNRRITAIQKLLKRHRDRIKGFEIDNGLLKQISKLSCVLIKTDGEKADDQIQKILGLRHHGSILKWEPLPAALNLYRTYMKQYCTKNNIDPTDNENFVYDASIARKVSAIFSVKLAYVRDRIKIYRAYLQLLDASHHHLKVEQPDTFSFIEETISRKSLVKRFRYDEIKSVFSDEGVDEMFDLYFGLKGKEAVITGASTGDSNIRDFAYVVEQGTEENVRQIVDGREKAQRVRNIVEIKTNAMNLQSTLELVMDKLLKIPLGDIGLGGFAPNEKECINRIDQRMMQLKRAAGLL
ncbi:MAG: ParB N-terminal domain-containing protein [Bacteroidetes bacterium]|nr:ParB N-terminal domain-containing protein [Bacteroidota bacterium]